MTTYEDAARERADSLIKTGRATILAIETSCDETAAAVVRDGRTVLGAAVHTQIPLHEKYGGVVPELASRSHVERIGPVVAQALESAGATLETIDAVAVTYGPGLVGALLVGVSYAKGLALAKKLPLVGVNHIFGHVAANYLTYPELEPPFVCLVASGGHTHLLLIEDYISCRLLGRTRDDAAGEAFDKVARALGLGYPGGPKLEALARQGDPNRYAFHAGFNAGQGLDMSFSGVKTAVVNLLHNAGQKGETLDHADIAASFERSVVETLAHKSVLAAGAANVRKLALAGGVSANQALRARMEQQAKRAGLTFYTPKMEYCTDNAAMIGCAGHYALLAGRRDSLALNACPQLSLKAQD
ncbi:MAG: tRNA (adenosine(37)-N6)-threonylcarbamoyltransferase complex transferase subunit TsaD [Bacillota bacterium]